MGKFDIKDAFFASFSLSVDDRFVLGQGVAELLYLVFQVMANIVGLGLHRNVRVVSDGVPYHEGTEFLGAVNREKA